jgi:very-short-patch-repair endonuclease
MCQDYFHEFRKEHPVKSKYHSQHHYFLRLNQIIKQSGLENEIKIENEVTIDPYDMIYADLVMRDKKIIIEVDGAQHYLFGDIHKILAVDKFDRKLKEMLGYQVKVLNIEEFSKVDPELKNDFLKSLIALN